MFSEQNCLRQVCIQLNESQIFENIITTIIVLSSFTLAMENPLNDPEHIYCVILHNVDGSITVIFALEFIIRVIAEGFACNGSKSYIRDPWHILDFIIVFSSLISPLVEGMSAIKIVRMMRLMRPLRIIAKSDELKISI